MSPKLPRITAAEVIRALRRAGWYIDYQRGSHVCLRHPNRNIRVTVAIHAGETIKPKTLQSILKQAEMTVFEFKSFYRGGFYHEKIYHYS